MANDDDVVPSELLVAEPKGVAKRREAPNTPERIEALGRAVARVLQGSSMAEAARAENVPHSTLRRHVARTGEYVAEARERIALVALDAAGKAADRMSREMASADERVVAQWARASASLAGLEDAHEGSASAGDAVRALVEILRDGGGKVTLAAQVESGRSERVSATSDAASDGSDGQ
jgi:hypothetical protein